MTASTSRYRDQAAEVIRAVTVLGAAHFAWFGKPVPRLPRSVERSLTPRTARAYLVYTIQNQLYSFAYCLGAPAETLPNHGAAPAAAGSFRELLAGANSGRGGSQPGWTVLARSGDTLKISRNGLMVQAEPEACLPANGEEITPGAAIALRFPAALHAVSPGYYLALGDVPLDEAGGAPLLRLYWNLTAAGAPELVRHGTRLLNAAAVPFRLKVLSEPEGYMRCDAGVIYLPCEAFPCVAEQLRELYAQLARFLKPATPLFTRAVAPGLGLAEDPGGQESFGQQRCRLLAEAIVAAHEQGARDSGERLELAAAHFAAAGLSLDQPYLNPGSTNCYDLGQIADRQIAARRLPPQQGVMASDYPDALGIAQALGERLCREALWHDGRCTWMSPAPGDHGAPQATRARTTTMGPDLYDGVAGVAVFLADLAALDGGAAARATALGAIRQALASAERLSQHERLGLYSGWPGICCAAARVALATDDDEPLVGARKLLDALPAPAAEGQIADLLAGTAGAVLGLTALGQLWGEDKLIGRAMTLGDALIEGGVCDAHGLSWPLPELRTRHNLTGLSHGAGGIGLALLELFAACGEARFAEAARLAFSYEDRWFDPGASNWPDFRQGSQRRPSFAAFWCHGAPGIAVARLRALALSEDDSYRPAAIAALTTTKAYITATLSGPGGNFSLCHGLCGNAEVLDYGAQILGTPGADLIEQVAALGAERHADANGEPWPTGAAGGESLGLMLGIAGIGHFYLRRHKPSVAPVLLPHCLPTPGLIFIDQS